MENQDKINQLLSALEEKYKLEEQELVPYLEGLLHAEYINYWDFINLDALLSLQVKRSRIPDEMIFIIYHQITELYFKLCLWEYEQILTNEKIEAGWLEERLRRIVAYFTNLTRSFEIMVDGMEKEQFLKFRLTLMPASGFQSAQYRKIEIASTDLINLTDKAKREDLRNASIEEQYGYIYWKYGATEIDTGKKTLTLRQFENKYADELIAWAKKHENRNLASLYRNLPEELKNRESLKEAFRNVDALVNVNWPLMHYRSAARYLLAEKAGIPATGGTNWQQYLPPRFQRRIFFPELWTEEELKEWGLRGN